MALIGIFFLKAIMSIIINWVIQRFIMIRDIKMRSYLMHSYQELPYSEYINRNSSEYIHTINNRVACYSGGVLQPARRGTRRLPRSLERLRLGGGVVPRGWTKKSPG